MDSFPNNETSKFKDIDKRRGGGVIMYQFIWYWKLKQKLSTATDTGLFGVEEIILVRGY
jgi:hypothetical protein